MTDWLLGTEFISNKMHYNVYNRCPKCESGLMISGNIVNGAIIKDSVKMKGQSESHLLRRSWGPNNIFEFSMPANIPG